MTIRIDWHMGPRADLRPLFVLADDSDSQVEAYLVLGRVLAVRRADVLIAHAQLVPSAKPGEIELKSIAVLPHQQRKGVGRALVEFAFRDCAGEGWSRMTVATAAADTGNLRFYQRMGFRLVSIEMDAFTPAAGYPPMTIDGIPLLDRVWLARDLLHR